MTLYQSIHQEAIRAARTHRKSEHSLLCAIQRVDAKKVYLQFGYKNLYEYCIKCLLLSEGTAYGLIRVARKSIEIPEIQKEIALGNLTLSHAKSIVSVITTNNQNEWIEKAKSLSVRDLEKEVAQAVPSATIREKIKPVAENRLELECGLDLELEQMIQRAKDLLCQKKGRAVNLEETLRYVFSDYLKRTDPLEQKARLSTWTKSHPLTARPTVATKKEVLRRDEGKCQGKDPNGNTCGQGRWLDVHHIHPISQGGDHAFGNLITLCRDHHRLAHLNQ